MKKVRLGWDGRALVSRRYIASLLGASWASLVSLAERAEAEYAPFEQSQVRHGKTKTRHIDNPRQELKYFQGRIKAAFLDYVALPSFVSGGVHGRSIRDNASFHVGCSEVVAMDLRNCFPSLSSKRIASVWRGQFGASSEVTWLLTRLTTFKGHLPQGAPTSTTLANLAILPASREIHDLCSENGFNFSIYIDDLTLSGRLPSSLVNDIARILSRHRLSLARGKLAVMHHYEAQEVTGLLVNRKLSIPRERMRKTRAAVLAVRNADRDSPEWRSAHGLVSHVQAIVPRRARWLKRTLGR